MRHVPLKYKGLTVILDRPSRHDKQYLLSGYAGQYFDCALKPLNRINCDIRTLNCNEPLLDETKTILLLGQDSLSSISGNDSLNFFRGSPYFTRNGVAIATYTPQDSYDRKDYEAGEEEENDEDSSVGEKEYQHTKRANWRWWMQRDIRKAVRYTTEGYKQPEEYVYNINPPLEKFIRFSHVTKGKKVFLDIENNIHRQLTCIGFGTFDKKEIYVLPILKYNQTIAYEFTGLYEIIRCIARLFANNTIIGHNIGHYDLLMLANYYGIPFPRQIEDTMIIQHRIYPQIEKSLGHCVSLYLDYPNHKGEGIYNTHNSDQDWQLWKYNGKDVARTIEIYKEQQLELLRTATLDSAIQANKSIRSYMIATMFGIKLDIPYMEKLHGDFLARFIQVQRVLRILTGRDINPRSPKQVAHYLYNELKLDNPGTSKAKDQNGEEKLPTDKKALYKLYIKYATPSLRCILECRNAGKRASSLQFKMWKGDRLTSSNKVSGTVEFRLASTALWKFKSDKGYGTNTQNWNKQLRRCVIADEGKLLGQCDQEGADTKIIAYLCRNGRYRQLFDNGIKPHIYVALRLFPKVWEQQLGESVDRFINAPIPKLKDEPRWNELVKIIKATDDAKNPRDRYYYLGKKTGLSAGYDMKWPTFQLKMLEDSEGEILLTNKEAQYFLDFYKHELFPEIPEWWRQEQDYLKYKSRRVRNFFGFSCEFAGLLDDNLFRKVYAWKPASTVATITNIAWTKAQDLIENKEEFMRDVDLLQNGHDSIFFQAPQEIIHKSGEIIRNLLRTTLRNERGEELTIGSSLAIGKNWAPKTEYNLDGLEEVK